MTTAVEHAADYREVMLFLATAGVAAPILKRFRVSPVLGFLAAGAVLGPFGLGALADEVRWLSYFTIAEPEEIRVLGELGVVFLLFAIGLELSWERLKTMRRLILGLGTVQVLVSAAVIAAVATALGQPLGAAVALGAALSLSSTAIVAPILAESRRLKKPPGRAAFAVLLAQDLAVAPLLFAVTFLAAGALDADPLQTAIRFILTLLPAALAVLGIVVIGRLALRPLLRSVARSDSREMFFACCLFIVIGAGMAAAVSGLSMALGAFIAGLLLAETEFRREVEITIRPFEGLLLGLFFVSVGIGLDVAQIAARPALVLGLTFGVIALKTLVVLAVGRAMGLDRRTALEAGLVLGPAGEFAFVILATALGANMIDPVLGQAALLSATLGMFLVPALARLGRKVGWRPDAATSAGDFAAAPPPEDDEARVIIAGYGRVGALVGSMLRAHDVRWLAIDSDPRAVAAARSRGEPVHFGDAARPEFLAACGLKTARALVVTMDAPGKVDEVVAAGRAAREDLVLIARARDDRHAARLYAMGVTDAVPETTEASLQLAENTLVDIGVPMGLVLASVHEQRDVFRRQFQAAMPGGGGDRRVRALRAGARKPAADQGA